MKNYELKVGDIVLSKGSAYLVTNTKPFEGIKDYICVMTKDGLARDMWCEYVEKVLDHSDKLVDILVSLKEYSKENVE